MFKQYLKIRVLSSQDNSSKHNNRLDHHGIQLYDKTAQYSVLTELKEM